MPRAELLRLEKEATGIYLSGHPMENYEAYSRRIGAAKTNDILLGKHKDGSRITLVALIDNIKPKMLKNGQIICSATAEDLYGSIDLTIFNTAYTMYKPLLFDSNILLLSGKISEREDKPTEIICDGISVIDEDKIVLTKQTKKVYIRVPTINCPATAKIKELLPLYKGNTPVIFFANDTKKQFAVPDNMKIDEKSEIYAKISEIVGNNNIKTVE